MNQHRADRDTTPHTGVRCRSARPGATGTSTTATRACHKRRRKILLAPAAFRSENISTCLLQHQILPGGPAGGATRAIKERLVVAGAPGNMRAEAQP